MCTGILAGQAREGGGERGEDSGKGSGGNTGDTTAAQMSGGTVPALRMLGIPRSPYVLAREQVLLTTSCYPPFCRQSSFTGAFFFSVVVWLLSFCKSAIVLPSRGILLLFSPPVSVRLCGGSVTVVKAWTRLMTPASPHCSLSTDCARGLLAQLWLILCPLWPIADTLTPLPLSPPVPTAAGLPQH